MFTRDLGKPRWLPPGWPIGDGGMSTAEYAIGTIGAAAFAAVLYTVVTGRSVADALASLVDRALQVPF